MLHSIPQANDFLQQGGVLNCLNVIQFSNLNKIICNQKSIPKRYKIFVNEYEIYCNVAINNLFVINK